MHPPQRSAHSPLGPEEIRHLVSVRRRATPLQDLLRPGKTRSQGSKAALRLHPSPSRKCSLPTGDCARTRVPGHGRLSLGPHRAAALSRQDGGCAGAESGRPGGRGHFPRPLLGAGPGGLGFAPSGGALGRYDPRLGPRENLEFLKRGARLPKGRPGKHAHLCHRAPCPPAAEELPVTPLRTPSPHTHTHTHTHTVRRGLAWRRGGGGLGGKSARQLPLRAGSRAPEKVFPPTRAPGALAGRGGFQDTREVDRCRRAAGAFPEQDWVRPSGKARPAPAGGGSGTGRRQTFLSAGNCPDPAGRRARSGCPGNRRRGLSRDGGKR